MFHGHEDKTTMRSPGSGSDGSKCRHVFSPALRVKKPGSRVCHLHWFHIPLLIVLLAGQASCQTSPAPFLTTINAETSVHYSVHIIVDINGEEKNESEIVAWLRQVFQNRLDDCRLPTTAIPTTPQTTSSNTSNETTLMMTATLRNFNTTRPTAGATTSLGINTSTAAATTSLGINNTSTAATTLFKSNITTLAATSTDSISDNTSTVAATTSVEIHNMTTAAKSTALKIHNRTSIATTLLKSNNTTTAATTIASQRNITTTTAATTAKALEPFISSTTSSAAILAPAIVRMKRALEIINPNQSHKQRVARQIGSSVGPASGINNENTPGLFQKIEVTCKKDSAIRNTSCFVTLSLKHRVPPCCILRVLCAASKNSSEINVVGKRVDELSQIKNECSNETQMESSCKYSGQTGASCEEFGPAYVANQSNSAICGTNKKNCSCSDYCNGTDVFYTFEISIKDPKIALSDVMSLLSKFEQRPDCADIPTVPCPLSIIVPEYKDVYVACGGGGAKSSCRVLLRLESKVHICDVSAAVMEVFQSEKQVRSNGLVTRAAICGEVGDNPLESPFRVDKVNLKPGNFCTTIEDSNIINCRNGTTVIVLLEEQCVHRPSFTPGPGNVTTAQPNSPTSSPIIVTSFQMNTTALSLNTTTSVSNATITATLNTTQTTTSTLNVTVTSTLNTTQTTTSALNVTVTSTLNTTQTTTNQSVPVSLTSKSPNVNTTASNVTVAATFNTTAQTLITTTGASNVTVTATLNPTQTTTNDSVPVNTTNSPPTTLSAEGQAGALLRLTEDVSQLNSSQVERLVSDLERLLSGPTVSLSLGNISVHIISNLLGASSETLSSSSNRIIGIVDTVALKLVLEDTPETLLSSAVALSVKPADGTNFQETVFSISDPSTVQVRGDTRVKRAVRTDSSIPQGSIRLPPSLTQNLTPEEQQQVSRVQFNFYQKSTVFQDQSLGERKLNSGILGASAANLSITGLQEEVLIHLRNIEPVPGNFVAKCVFWDFTLNNRSGGWNENGCTVRNSTDNETVCGCNHLTSFAILLDLNRDPEITRLQSTILTFITYIGCGISCIFLSVTLLTYLAFEKLRKDIPSKILIQLCLSLLLLNMVFLVDAWLALYPDAVGLCISTAWFLHYFLLVTFTWMGLEAVHMYLALVKVFNTYVSRYMLKFSLVGWGVPMIVVIIVIAVDKDNYGMVSYGRFTDGTSDDFCWLKNDIAFYVAVVAYFCVIFVFNFIMFIVVLVQLCRLRRQNPHNMRHRTSLQDARSVCGITLLLGLTWGFAFFAWGPVNLPFMYLFAIFNSLQGFFIFVFHCAVKENVRKQWKTYLCCGGMRLPKNSEWSRTATQKTVKRSSVSRLTSLHSSSSNNLSSSSSFLASDSSEQMTGIGNPADDQAIRADEGANGDVILNELNSQQRTQQAP